MLPVTKTTFTSIATFENTWIAVGFSDNGGNDSGVALKSVDGGKNWTTENLPSNIMQLNKITYDHGVWLAGGKTTQSQLVLLKKTDGIDWQIVSIPTPGGVDSTTDGISDILWKGTHWLAIGGDYDPMAWGCPTLHHTSWQGQLNNSSGDTVNFKSLWFNVFSSASTSKEGNMYEIKGDLDLGNFTFNDFKGTCIEHNDGSVDINLSRNINGFDIILAGTHNSPNDATLSITKYGVSSYNNFFTGVLQKQNLLK